VEVGTGNVAPPGPDQSIQSTGTPGREPATCDGLCSTPGTLGSLFLPAMRGGTTQPRERYLQPAHLILKNSRRVRIPWAPGGHAVPAIKDNTCYQTLASKWAGGCGTLNIRGQVEGGYPTTTPARQELAERTARGGRSLDAGRRSSVATPKEGINL
jgi:hypothetical protein